ncbi:hypothetical protein M0657_002872 [Pyricularia oryzae]|nr:hypothetical protein M9X92_009302 [Pyricularia oryzae]KAI7928031.1 hypothetical protein M0657_002872 [Pyricularia oryzae]
MLRRPPTAIVIVASEVRAYEERRQARRHAFQSGNSIKSVSEVESNDPERNSSSPGADVKTGGSDTNDFSDALAPSPDPSVLGNGEQDELAKALNNLAQGRSIIFESPSLSVRLKATQPDGTNTATFYTLVKTHVFGHDFVNAACFAFDDAWVAIVAPSGFLAEHEVCAETCYSSPVTVSPRSNYRVREPPETPPRSSSLQAGGLESLPSSGAPERSASHRPRPPVVILRSLESSIHAALNAPQVMGESSALYTDVAQPSSSSSLQLDGNHDFQIYNDELPADQQPQTPQNLPEARHSGRLGAALTAPVTRIGVVQDSAAATARAAIALVTPTTASRRERPRREQSPPGLNTPGFRGLYGGLENTDDAVLYEAGYRMTNHGSRHLEAEGNQEERR